MRRHTGRGARIRLSADVPVPARTPAWLPGQVVLQTGVAELVHRADLAEYPSPVGILQEPHHAPGEPAGNRQAEPDQDQPRSPRRAAAPEREPIKPGREPDASPNASPTVSPAAGPNTSPNASPNASPTATPATTSSPASPVTPARSPARSPNASPATSPAVSHRNSSGARPRMPRIRNRVGRGTTRPPTSPATRPYVSPTASPPASPPASACANPTTRPRTGPGALSMSRRECMGDSDASGQVLPGRRRATAIHRRTGRPAVRQPAHRDREQPPARGPWPQVATGRRHPSGPGTTRQRHPNLGARAPARSRNATGSPGTPRRARRAVHQQVRSRDRLTGGRRRAVTAGRCRPARSACRRRCAAARSWSGCSAAATASGPGPRRGRGSARRAGSGTSRRSPC